MTTTHRQRRADLVNELRRELVYYETTISPLHPGRYSLEEAKRHAAKVLHCPDPSVVDNYDETDLYNIYDHEYTEWLEGLHYVVDELVKEANDVPLPNPLPPLNRQLRRQPCPN